MEQEQELQALDKSMMTAKLVESSSNEPETWYKDVLNASGQKFAESLSHSEDELSTSQGRCLANAGL